MSREERRAYQRQMKGMERGPAIPPAARARAERKAARRARRAEASRPGDFTTRFWIRSVLIAAAIGFIAFSLQWSNGMPTALYIGLAVAAVVLLIVVGLRFLQRRAGAAS
ncbi:MAG: hypothetical protein M3Y40_02195 [Chloroflexota bacterium]|nr:hypothetical protein [Chloroflexota bacterium]